MFLWYDFMYVHKSCTVFYVKILVHEFYFQLSKYKKIRNLKTFWYVSNKFDYVNMSFCLQSPYSCITSWKKPSNIPATTPGGRKQSTFVYTFNLLQFHEAKIPNIFKSISFIDTSLLQFTMHSTDLVQYSLNHNCINHFVISCITMFDICNNIFGSIRFSP